MSKIYVGQTKLDIILCVGEDITGATSAEIKYEKPDATSGSFAATITDEQNGKITYSVQNATDIDQAGDWKFWAYLTFTSGKTIPGVAQTIKVYEEGK